jgi:hypothetical protein
MEQSNRLVATMAEQCRELIRAAKAEPAELSAGLQPMHLLAMCERIQEHADDWPATKLHRWIGFVQGAMIANRLLDVDRAKAIFEKAKTVHGVIPEDQDLIDHLDPQSSFRMELGGQG